jgi:hypothetical protein
MNIAKPEKQLPRLAKLVKKTTATSAEEIARTQTVPEDIVPTGDGENEAALTLSRDEERARVETLRSLAADLRFEHLENESAEQAVWRLICLVHFRPDEDHVAAFFAEHARPVEDRTCFFPVELLTVSREIELFGALLMPASSSGASTDALPQPKLAASVIGVPVRGTNRKLMTERGRDAAERALRLWRVSLREHISVPDRQLRFGLGETSWLDDQLASWRTRSDTGWELELDEDLINLAERSPFVSVSTSPSNEIDRRIDLALQWWERAHLATEQVVQLLYLFFALEAILGDKSEGLKAAGLAVRRGVLGLLTRERAAHPARIYVFYDRIRSAAVHGEEPPAIAAQEASAFSWDVRRAIGEYRELVDCEGLTKRSQVRARLDNHERRATLVADLLQDNPKLWGEALASDDA